MKKSGIEIIVGLLLLPLTIFVGYLYMKSLNDNGNLLFLGLTFFLGGAGVFCLFRGTNPKEKKDSLEVVPAVNDTGLEKQLQQNNQMIEDWKEAKGKRDKLQMMELGGMLQSEESKK